MIYTYACPGCGRRQTIVKKLALIERDEPCVCGVLMQRQITAPMVRPDYPGYECPSTGKWVEGRKAHAENLKRTGCRLLEPGEREQSVSRREAASERLYDQIAESAAAEVMAMPTEKREALGAALSSTEVSFDRKSV